MTYRVYSSSCIHSTKRSLGRGTWSILAGCLLTEGDDGTRMDRRVIVNALRVGMREDVDGWRAPSSVALACDPIPFCPRPLSEMVPFSTDHVPVHHWALRAR
jgi:hypothetical protein